MMLIVTVLHLLSPSAFAYDSDPADRVKRVACKCYVGGVEVGTEEIYTTTTNYAVWVRKVTAQCQEKHGKVAQATGCKPGN